ncbi:MAG: GNAT family N-acetyltransferase, partial [Henriciella sp.]
TRSWRRFLLKPDAVQLAELDGQIAGAAVLLFRTGSRKARLYSIATAEFSRGRGVARALMERCERVAKSRGCEAISLEVHENNRNAIALYNSAGFRVTGTKQGFYSDGANAIVMGKRLATSGPGQ